MGHKTRKIYRIHTRICDKDAKKGTMLKCRLKTCRAKKYQSVYGGTASGAIRSRNPLYF